MTAARIIELAIAVVLLGAGLWFYTRRVADESRRDRQGSVLLFAVAAILGIHALGGLDYHPSDAERAAVSGQ